MTHPTLKDAARALYEYWLEERQLEGFPWDELPPDEQARWGRRARATIESIRPPDREDLSLRQLEARDYIDGIIGKREIEE